MWQNLSYNLLYAWEGPWEVYDGRIHLCTAPPKHPDARYAICPLLFHFNKDTKKFSFPSRRLELAHEIHRSHTSSLRRVRSHLRRGRRVESAELHLQPGSGNSSQPLGRGAGRRAGVCCPPKERPGVITT